MSTKSRTKQKYVSITNIQTIFISKCRSNPHLAIFISLYLATRMAITSLCGVLGFSFLVRPKLSFKNDEKAEGVTALAGVPSFNTRGASLN